MTDIAKKLNITLEPFCVRTEEFTEQEIQDLLDHCVDLGAEARECFKGSHESRQEYYGECWDNALTYVGVCGELWTWISNVSYYYNDNLLSRQEALAYLKLKEEDDRLVVVKEGFKLNPPSADTVISMTRGDKQPPYTVTCNHPEVDEDGFITWEGGDMPVEKGTMVHVKYHGGDECICTAGLGSYNPMFKRILGHELALAIVWRHDSGFSDDIVAYKVYTEQPVEPQETISEESGANVLVQEKASHEGLQEVSLSLEEVLKDLESWGNALNDAGWEASSLYEKYFREKQSPTQFNNGKGYYREIIRKYLQSVYSAKEEEISKDL